MGYLKGMELSIVHLYWMFGLFRMRDKTEVYFSEGMQKLGIGPCIITPHTMDC